MSCGCGRGRRHTERPAKLLFLLRWRSLTRRLRAALPSSSLFIIISLTTSRYDERSLRADQGRQAAPLRGRGFFTERRPGAAAQRNLREENPRRTSGEPQENPRRTSGEPQENIRRTSGEHQENIRRRTSGEPQENPRRTSGGEPQENPRRTPGERQENPRGTSGEPQENLSRTSARRTSGEPQENPRRTSGEPQENLRRTSAEPPEGEPQASSGGEPQASKGGSESPWPWVQPQTTEHTMSPGLLSISRGNGTSCQAVVSV